MVHECGTHGPHTHSHTSNAHIITTGKARSRGGEIRTGSRSEVVGSGSGGWAVEDPGSQIGRQRSQAKTGARRIHDARWRVAFAMAGGGARAPDRMISARVTLRGGYRKCRLQ